MQGKITEIQYLRAIAVLFVFLFHLDKENFPGGFIGVDIFFLISGFLMLKILNEKIFVSKILHKKTKKNFSCINIYFTYISILFSKFVIFRRIYFFY